MYSAGKSFTELERAELHERDHGKNSPPNFDPLYLVGGHLTFSDGLLGKVVQLLQQLIRTCIEIHVTVHFKVNLRRVIVKPRCKIKLFSNVPKRSP